MGKEETPKELHVHLRDLFQRWVQPQWHNKEEIKQTIILEQFLHLVSPKLQVWINDRNPTSAVNAAALADVFVATEQKVQPWTYAQRGGGRDSNRPPQQPLPPKKTSTEGKSVADRSVPFKQNPVLKTSGPKPPVCYHCGQKGHIKPKCPNNPANQSCICTVLRSTPPKNPVALHCHAVILNGWEVRALEDTWQYAVLSVF